MGLGPPLGLPNNSSPKMSPLAPTEGSLAYSTPPSERKGSARVIQKVRGAPDRPHAPCRGSGALPATLPKPRDPNSHLWARQMQNLSLKVRKRPWGNESTPLGPRGLHPAGALARTRRGLEVQKTQSLQERLQAESRQTLRESARTPPKARGLLSCTIKRGTPSVHQKSHLNPINNEARR